MLPLYQATLEVTKQPDLAPEPMSWLRVMFSNTVLARALAEALPAALMTPGVFPEAVLPGLQRAAAGYGGHLAK